MYNWFFFSVSLLIDVFVWQTERTRISWNDAHYSVYVRQTLRRSWQY